MLLAAAIALSCVACGQKEETPAAEPNVSQMKAICELSVMDCYYHNVAKYYEKDAQKGFLGIGKKDKRFWVEYSGVVQLGIDASLVKIEAEGDQITITLPEAKVLDCKIDSNSLTENSYIVEKDSADIVADDEIMAFNEAQSKMEEAAANDKVLLANAQLQAQDLLEEYIKNIGSISGKTYTLKWVYVDADGKPIESAVKETVEPAPDTSTTEKPAV